jgi:hypothetical protein
MATAASLPTIRKCLCLLPMAIADASENLAQGAVIDGMSEMRQEISLRNGRVVQRQFLPASTAA